MGVALGAAVAGTALNGVGGFAKWREGRKMQRQAQRAIDNFEWDELKNPYKDLTVSTLGADLQREEAARASATAVQALTSAGSRALGVGAGRVIQANNNITRQTAADLDMQQKNIDFAAAQDDTRIRDMEERRKADELSGYGQMLNIGNQMKYQGVADLSNTAMLGTQVVSAYDAYRKGKNPGGMGGGMMGGGGFNDNAAMYAQQYGGSYA